MATTTYTAPRPCPDDHLRVWTIQAPEVWETLRETGYFLAEARHQDPDLGPTAYPWMVARMHERLPTAPAGFETPIWVWAQWRGAARPKPDLRSRFHHPAATRGVRLELVVPRHELLLSDFELWHFVLNYWHLPTSDEEGDAFEARCAARGLSFFRQKPLPDPELHAAVESSWSRCLDLDWHAPGLAEPRADKQIQGVCWGLRLEWVRRVETFTAR